MKGESSLSSGRLLSSFHRQRDSVSICKQLSLGYKSRFWYRWRLNDAAWKRLNVLIINNLFQGSGINEIEGAGLDSGVVFAYNYARDSDTSQVYNVDAEHSGSPNFILREGNQFGGSEDDGTWGTHNFDTWFRNYYACWDPSYLGGAAPRGIIIDNYARFENAIGNAIGSNGECTSYQGVGSSPFIFGFGSDPLALSTSMRWGNYDTVTGAVGWSASEVPTSLGSNAAFNNPVPSDTNLPASFFMR